VAKTAKLVKAEPITVELDEYRLQELAESAIERLVGEKIDAAIESSVAVAVGEAVEKIGQKRIAAEIEKVLAEGWLTVNEYGESRGGVRKSLKDRIGEILNHKDHYSSRGRWIDELVKKQVDAALAGQLKPEIESARQKFKSEVDGVLTGVIKKAVAEHFGIKQ
jgi:hypothetical protein